MKIDSALHNEISQALARHQKSRGSSAAGCDVGAHCKRAWEAFAAKPQSTKRIQLGEHFMVQQIEVHARSPLRYELYGIDGSAIYPDRHFGNDWFLVSTALAYLNYETQTSSASIQTHYSCGHRDELVGAANVLGGNCATAIDEERSRVELEAHTHCLWQTDERWMLFDGLLSYTVQQFMDDYAAVFVLDQL